MTCLPGAGVPPSLRRFGCVVTVQKGFVTAYIFSRVMNARKPAEFVILAFVTVTAALTVTALVPAPPFFPCAEYTTLSPPWLYRAP